MTIDREVWSLCWYCILGGWCVVANAWQYYGSAALLLIWHLSGFVRCDRRTARPQLVALETFKYLVMAYEDKD